MFVGWARKDDDVSLLDAMEVETELVDDYAIALLQGSAPWTRSV